MDVPPPSARGPDTSDGDGVAALAVCQEAQAATVPAAMAAARAAAIAAVPAAAQAAEAAVVEAVQAPWGAAVATEELAAEPVAGQAAGQATVTSAARAAVAEAVGMPAVRVQATPFQFMGPLRGQWVTMSINSEYVPKIGTHYDATTGRWNAPTPKTARAACEILAMKAMCGTGKSTVFRQFMKESVFATKPEARVLLLSANILYGTNLTHELRQSGFPKVGFYRDKDVDLSTCQTVVCSLESLHHLEGQRFDAILIDEVRTIARLVGGGTMHDFNNVHLLHELCSQWGTQVVVCDADLDFKIDPSEPHTLTYDFLKLIAPDRSVIRTMQTMRPPHLERSARLFFDCARSDGRKNWFEELENAAKAWHADHGGASPPALVPRIASLARSTA